ncbi:hypothetical protein WP8W19C03_P11080 (plasmid) [Aeromonas veronii]|nr:hypothetical protein ACGSH8M1_p11250 [Aeromonas caviae]BBT55218.1 hypothetical protein WP8S18C01_P10380 [Aeromonas caviae]BBT97461.1 hypothetical protein WP8W19C03_P11080 [Aeromonas veronii]
MCWMFYEGWSQVVWKASYSPFGKASINRESNDEYRYIHFYYYCSFGS